MGWTVLCKMCFYTILTILIYTCIITPNWCSILTTYMKYYQGLLRSSATSGMPFSSVGRVGILGSSPGLVRFAVCHSPSSTSCFMSSLNLSCQKEPYKGQKIAIIIISSASTLRESAWRWLFPTFPWWWGGWWLGECPRKHRAWRAEVTILGIRLPVQ